MAHKIPLLWFVETIATPHTAESKKVSEFSPLSPSNFFSNHFRDRANVLALQ
jgi:hypothetical protein